MWSLPLELPPQLPKGFLLECQVVLRGFLILLHLVLCISSSFKMIYVEKKGKIGVGISSRITLG